MAEMRDALRAGSITGEDMMMIYPNPALGAEHVDMLKQEGLYGLGSAAP